MVRPAAVLGTAAGLGGAYGINRALTDDSPSMLDILGSIAAIGGTGALGYLALRAMRRKKEREPEAPMMLPSPGPSAGGGGSPVNVSVNPTLHQILGSPGTFGQQTNVVPPGTAKEAMEKLARGGGLLKGLGGLFRGLKGGPKTPGSTIGSLAGGSRRGVLGYPFRAAGRLSGVSGNRARSRIAKGLTDADRSEIDDLWGQFRRSGADLPGYMEPGIGPLRIPGASPRVASRAQHLVERGLDPQFRRAIDAGAIRGPGGEALDMRQYVQRLKALRDRQIGGGQANPETVGQALQGSRARWYDYALPAAGVGGTALALGAGRDPEEMANDRNENFLTRSMTGVGEWLEDNMGMEGVGNWVQRHPYLSAGGGAIGSVLLMLLLSKLLGR